MESFREEGKSKIMSDNFHPPHIYQDNTFYFITAHTIKKEDTFSTKEKMNIYSFVMETALTKFDYHLFAWVYLPNHYHIILDVKHGKEIGKFISNFHSNTARLLNQMDNKEGRKIWYQYWDRCIRGEKDFYARVNYIHHNPVKHGLTESMNKYQFSSYSWFQSEYGEEWLRSCFEMYPIIDFTPEGIE